MIFIPRKRTSGLATLLFICQLTCLIGFATSANAEELHPKNEYTPEQVVQIVLEALRTNDSDDQGIATVFRFASPANKRNTGPLDRFTTMIKRGFPDMLNHTASETEALEIRGGIAIQPVWLTTEAGQEVGYLFQLGKQTGGEHQGSWMTDAVIPLVERGQSI